MKTKFSDKQKKEMIALYLETNNYSIVARKYGCAVNSVKAIVKNDPEFANKLNLKKEKDIEDILEWLDAKKEVKKKILESSLIIIHNKIVKEQDKMSIADLIRIYGTLTDKELAMKDLKIKQEGNDNAKEINNSIVNIATLINNPKPTRELSEFDE